MVSRRADALWRGATVVEMGNAALPVLGLLRGEDERVEGLKAERLTQFGWQGRGGERARARWSGQQQWWLDSLLRENKREAGTK
jgi:hypothetical protein